MSRCFIIGPIGDKFAPVGSAGRERYEDAIQVFESVILPACRANGLEPVRADGIAKSGEITEQIFRHLSEDEVVIADVSGGNPNVMYELGLRHTRDLLTIQIGEYGQLPFDVNAVRTIQFSRSDRGLIDARKLLEQALTVGLAEGGDSVTATRVWLSLTRKEIGSAASAEGVVAEPDESNEEDLDEAGFLERLATIEVAFPNLTEHISSIGEIIERLGSAAEAAGQEIQLANTSGAPTKARLALVQRFATMIQPIADELSENTGSFASIMESVDPDVHGLLRFISDNEDVDSENVDEFLDSLIGVAESSRVGMESLNQFGSIVRDLGSISKVLRRPGRQMAEAINTMAAATAAMDDWEAEASVLRRRHANGSALDVEN